MSAKDLERNLLAIAIAGSSESAARIAAEITDDDLQEGYGRWLLGEIRARIGQGHQLHDLLPSADEQQARYLVELHSRYLTSATADSLIGAVKQAARTRRARSVLTSGLARLKDGDHEAVEETLKALAAVVVPSAVHRVHDAATILEAAKERVLEMRRSGARNYLPLGMPLMQRELAIQPGQLVLLGARTGVGKTAMALTWTWQMAFAGAVSVLYLNSEMSAAEIGLRLVSIGKGIPHTRLRVSPSEEDAQRIEQAIADYSTAPALTSEAIGELTSAEIVALSRYSHATRKLDVLVVDYIQRLGDARDRRDRQEWQVLMEITRTLKTLATDLGIVVICLAQLNSTGDLAASKGMANDCDLVLALERCADGTDPESKGPPKTVMGQTHLMWVQKGRHIRSDLKFHLAMDPLTLRFFEVA